MIGTIIIAAFIMTTVVHAQPQYRVLVVPPADITFTYPGVTITNVSICVREFDNDDTNTDYCPLGMTSLSADGPSGPPEILQFGDGHESLQGPYPSITFGTTTIRGIGLAVSLFGGYYCRGTSAMLGDPLIESRFLINPGQTESTGLLSICGGGEFRVSLRVECLSGYEGIDCNTPVPTTTETTTTTTTEATSTQTTSNVDPTTATPDTEAPTTATPDTEAPTTATPDTEAPTTATPDTEVPTTATPDTEAPTTATPDTEVVTPATEAQVPATETSTTTVHDTTTSVPYTTAAAANTDAQCVVPIAAGIGWGVASLLLNVVLTVVLVTVVLKRRNKGYAAHQRTTTKTTEEIDTSRNPVYGIHDSKTNTGQDSQEYEEVWLH